MIDDVKIGPCEASKYIQTSRIHYTQKGVQKAWDVVQVHDSVAIVLFHRDHAGGGSAISPSCLSEES